MTTRARIQSARELVEKWNGIFAKLPNMLVLAIIGHESGFNPNAIAASGGDAKRGGAYGLMQVTYGTANDIIPEIKKVQLPSVIHTLKKWDGTGKSLLDPDLNVLVGISYLNTLARRFNDDTDMVVAAYNRGPAGASKVLATYGKEGITSLPYVAAITVLRKELESMS